ncbi:helix-turn-helix domain-containing protein [Rhizobium sp. Root1220]|uniref:helix-turn-helix domain-containing protein n=1 Tax=Rhizobium sp. Root1220 TaxID=1736432 RepID=UPI0006F55194|nr:helix-turn-helix domain-containing protein [Rhizobium sp. Root1220]KQV68047.1 hypothetical protein ASC90_10310 [Rhizobium sp. Root1220]
MHKITVTLPEAVELSGIGRTSFYKLFNDGKLTPRKSGRRTLILVTELETYLKNLPGPPVSNRAQETNLEEPTGSRW